ncbi:MAG: amidohydrolase [Bacillota bacterium]
MKKILIKNALIIALDEERPDHFYGDILTDGDQIEMIAEQPDFIDQSLSDRVIDGSNLIVMPGFVNTHGHAAMSLFRSYADDMPLKEWLEKKIWPIEALLEGDDIYWGTMLSIAEMIRGGTTTFTDMYFFMDRVAEAVAETGIRSVLSRGLVGLNGGEQGLVESESFINNWHGAENGRITVMLGPHAPYTCPPEYLKKVMDLAEKTKCPIQIHLSETRKEVEDCLNEHGLTPPKLLSDLGLLDFKVVAAHCVHLNDQDIEILSEKKVGVAHNPGSNLKLGSGIAPVRKMLSSGVKVGIGTDGASSNNNLDMVEEMRLAALLSKGYEMDPTLIDANKALQMATSMGAEVLNLSGIGILKEGYKADLIGLRHDRLHLTPMHDPQAHLVYASAAADVQMVIVDGKLLLDNGEFTTLDEAKIRSEASGKSSRLIKARKESQ